VQEEQLTQQEFTRLYDKLLRHAQYKARRYFRDEVLRQDAAERAMNDAVDKWISEGCYDEELARRVIDSSLRQSSRKRELEPIPIDEGDGFHGYQLKEDK
jgi:polyhydroxyalkanoate synthesis regulator phasin